jgi:hypothetical protein
VKHQKLRRGTASSLSFGGTGLVTIYVLGLLVLTPGLHDAHAGRYDGLIVTGAQYGYGAQWGLYRIEEDAKELTQFIRGGAFPRYSPNRQSLIFARGGNLWLRNPDDSNDPSSAGELSWPDARHVAWGPDGRAIYIPFPIPYENLEVCVDLLRVEISAFEDESPFMDSATRLGAPRPEVQFPAVSRNGAIAVCAVDRLPGVGLVSAHAHLRTAEQGEWQRITPWGDDRLELRSEFSSSGGKLAFEVVDRGQRSQRVFVYDLAEKTLTQVRLDKDVPDFMQNCWLLGWQPNGEYLAIGYGRLDSSHERPTRLCLWRDGMMLEMMGGSKQISDTAWAPSGRQLAVIRDGSYRVPGASALVDAAIVVYTIDQSGRKTAADIPYEVVWTRHLGDFSRWDPVVPIDLEW